VSIEKAIGQLRKKKKREQSKRGSVAECEAGESTDGDTPDELALENLAFSCDDMAVAEAAKAPESKLPSESILDKNPALSETNSISAKKKPSSEESLNERVSLNYAELNRLGFITPTYNIENLEEEYRIIKRPIIMNAFAKGAAPVLFGNLVMITSALPGEGKSYTSMNLAMSMAMEMDSTVLLIDGDVIRASTSKMLGIDNRPGLTDLLEGKEEGIENVILSTDNPKLKIIPAGRRQTHSTELLASDLMGEIAKELSSRYSDRIILFDAPPLLATTEAIVLTHIMGQIIMVVEAGSSKKDEVKAALSTIDEEKVVGLILNKSRKNASGSYGGYYGGYGS